MLSNKIIKIISLMLFLFVIISCERDQCEPPFDIGMGLSGVLDKGPIERGNRFGIVIAMRTTSVSNLEDIEIKLNLPPELEIRYVPQQELSTEIMVRKGTIEWKGKLKPSTRKEFRFWLISKTDWTKWSYPIETLVSLNYRGKRLCNFYPNGHYSRTIIWSYKGFNDPDWKKPEWR